MKIILRQSDLGIYKKHNVIELIFYDAKSFLVTWKSNFFDKANKQGEIICSKVTTRLQVKPYQNSISSIPHP